MPDLRQEGTEQHFPAMEHAGQITLNELAERIERKSTYTVADIKGAVSAIADEIAHCIANGHSVKLNDMGIFTAALGVETDKRAKLHETDPGLNARSIILRKIHFKADKHWVAQANAYCRPERSKRRARQSSRQFSAEERLHLALDYLSRHDTLRIATYARLTGLLNSTATRELRRWADSPTSGIGTRGKGAHKVYVKRDAAED